MIFPGFSAHFHLSPTTSLIHRPLFPVVFYLIPLVPHPCSFSPFLSFALRPTFSRGNMFLSSLSGTGAGCKRNKMPLFSWTPDLVCLFSLRPRSTSPSLGLPLASSLFSGPLLNCSFFFAPLGFYYLPLDMQHSYFFADPFSARVLPFIMNLSFCPSPPCSDLISF